LGLTLGVGTALLEYVAHPVPPVLAAAWACAGAVEFTLAAVLARLIALAH
jgi:hypothetical protein